MVVHESSVNFENLIKDLADMYPFDVGTVVLVELLANALDSKATSINIEYYPQEKTLVVTDNGKGMTKDDFRQYHDFAAGLKTKGTGIGFAGVGAKISFNIANQVITETKSPSFSGGSNWYFDSNKKLIWEDMSPSNLTYFGTRVKITFRKDISLPFKNTDGIINLLRQHYLPLIDGHFLSLYSDLKYYNISLRFTINGREIEPVDIIKDYNLDKVHVFFPSSGSKKIGYGIFGLSTEEYPMGENLCGILLCTHGKVVKADLFNQFPSDIGPKIIGLVEIPDLIHFLTSSKTDFIKRGKYREFEKLYDPIRQEFRNWLKELGVQSSEVSFDDEAIKLEREIKKLIDEIPELNEFFGFRGKKKVLQYGTNEDIMANLHEGAEITYPTGNGETQGGDAVMDIGDGLGEALVEDAKKGDIRAKPISRTGRQGPKISFSDSPERVEIAWVDGNNIVINSGHPAYKKVLSNPQAKRIHCIHSIANAIQKFLYCAEMQELTFSDRFISAWGNK